MAIGNDNLCKNMCGNIGLCLRRKMWNTNCVAHNTFYYWGVNSFNNKTFTSYFWQHFCKYIESDYLRVIVAFNIMSTNQKWFSRLIYESFTLKFAFLDIIFNKHYNQNYKKKLIQHIYSIFLIWNLFYDEIYNMIVRITTELYFDVWF